MKKKNNLLLSFIILLCLLEDAQGQFSPRSKVNFQRRTRAEQRQQRKQPNDVVVNQVPLFFSWKHKKAVVSEETIILLRLANKNPAGEKSFVELRRKQDGRFDLILFQMALLDTSSRKRRN